MNSEIVKLKLSALELCVIAYNGMLKNNNKLAENSKGFGKNDANLGLSGVLSNDQLKP